MISADQALIQLMTQKAYDPMTQEDAQGLANEWYGSAAANGVSPEMLDASAGMPLSTYILKTFGESGQELQL